LSGADYGPWGFARPLQELQFQSLLADKPLEGCDPRFVFLDQVGGSSIVVEGAFLVFADPDTDQVTPADNQIGRYW
jgi:hypothetical protein